MKKAILLVLFSSFMASAPVLASDTPARPPIAKYVKAYVGAEGMKVWTLRVGERGQNQALVQVTGVDHDWDGRIQKMNIERQNKDTRYWLERKGKQFVALILQDGGGQVYLPDEGHPHAIHYDEKLSAQGNAEHFLTDYLQQPPAAN